MISAISAYRAMMESPASDRSAKRAASGTSEISRIAALSGTDNEVSGGSGPHGDFVDISASKDVFTAVESFFNLGKKNRFEDFHNLSPSDKEQFVMIVAELAKSGHVGYEELIVNNKIERHEVTDKIADERVRGAKVYDKP